MMRQTIVTSLLTLLFFASASPQLILISRDQEIEIGKEVAAQLEKEYGVWDDPEQPISSHWLGHYVFALSKRLQPPARTGCRHTGSSLHEGCRIQPDSGDNGIEKIGNGAIQRTRPMVRNTP